MKVTELDQTQVWKENRQLKKTLDRLLTAIENDQGNSIDTGPAREVLPDSVPAEEKIDLPDQAGGSNNSGVPDE